MSEINTLILRLPIPDAKLGQTRHGTTKAAAYAHASLVKQHRKDAELIARRAVNEQALTPFTGAVSVDVSVILPNRRRDFVNILVAMKPLLDGIEDAGVFGNDRQISMVNARLTAYDPIEPGLTLTITGETQAQLGGDISEIAIRNDAPRFA